MKKIIVIALSLALSSVAMSAQDMAAATDAFNNAGAAVSMGDYAGAIEYFKQAKELAEACGEEGAEIVTTCNDRIPRLTLQIAKEYIQEKKYDEAVAQLNTAVQVAGEFENAELAQEATELIPQVYLQKGNDFLKAKNFASAAESYKVAVAADTTNGMASLRLGQALASTGDVQGAEDAFLMALRNGQQANATKQLASMYQKLAASDLKAKKYADAVTNALKSNEYQESANNMKIAGTASMQLKKNADAISYLEQYVSMAPTARDVEDMYYTIAVLSQTSGDNSKACGYYQKIAGSAKYGEAAKAQITALKCN